MFRSCRTATATLLRVLPSRFDLAVAELRQWIGRRTGLVE